MMYIYTSGTTGYPKPTIIRHARFTMGGHSLEIVLELAAGRLLLRADAALSRLLQLRRLRARVPRRLRLRLAAQVLRQPLPRRRAAPRGHALHVRRRALPLPPAPATEPARPRSIGIRLATGPGLRPDIWRAFVRALRHRAHHRDLRPDRGESQPDEPPRARRLGRPLGALHPQPAQAGALRPRRGRSRCAAPTASSSNAGRARSAS